MYSDSVKYIDNIDNYFNEVKTRYPFDITWYIYNRLRKEKGLLKVSLPLKLGLKVSDMCNFKCPYCFVKKAPNNMSLDMVKHIVQSLEQKPYSVYLTGGEPMLNPEIFEIIDFLYQQNISIAIHTTGVLDEEIRKKLISNISKIDRIQISVDSIKNFDNLRPSNICSAVKMIEDFIGLIKSCKMLIINCVISSLNVDCVEDVIEFCSNNNIQYLRLSTIFTVDDSLELNDEAMLEKYSDWINIAREKDIMLLTDPLNHPWSIKLKLDCNENSTLFCPAQKIEVEIDPKGDVYPCPFLHDKHHKMGNIYAQPISEIWNNGVGALDRVAWSENLKCRKCEHYQNCGGGCYANAYVHYKNFDPRCCINEKDK